MIEYRKIIILPTYFDYLNHKTIQHYLVPEVFDNFFYSLKMKRKIVFPVITKIYLIIKFFRHQPIQKKKYLLYILILK